MTQSDLHNKSRVGLLRGAGTRFGTWFYAMIRLLRLKSSLKATIHDAKFVALSLNEAARQAVFDIENEAFWKAIYFVLRSVFPALRLLRFCDANRPAMDKMKHLAHRTTLALNKSVPFLNDEEVFGKFGTDDQLLSQESQEIFGEGQGEGEDASAGDLIDDG